jgi:hypothetical protein
MNPIYLMASTPAGFSYGFDDCPGRAGAIERP